MSNRTQHHESEYPGDVCTPIAETPRGAMTILLSEHEPLKLARMLDVHNAHIYKCRANGHISPTLERALLRKGVVEDKRRTKANGWLRRAAWLTTEQAARFDAARKAAGVSVGDILMKWTERQEADSG